MVLDEGCLAGGVLPGQYDHESPVEIGVLQDRRVEVVELELRLDLHVSGSEVLADRAARRV